MPETPPENPSEEQTPPDWVLLEAAKRTDWDYYSQTIERLRQEYGFARSTFRALCDMIAKYEQPPVDPDVEAVKRIFMAAANNPNYFFDGEYISRAVAQYKLERAK